MIDRRIGILGAGNMGGAILGGLLTAGLLDTKNVGVSDVSANRVAELEGQLGLRTTNNRELLEFADVVVLAIKPQLMTVVLDELHDVWRPDSLLLSILAGVSTAALESRVPSSVRVVRAMPNTPALVREAACAVARGSRATPSDTELARLLFGCVGRTVEVPEALMDAVTGLSGSGPAFVLLAIEAMADGAVRTGMPRALALELAAQTAAGAARMMLLTGEHPAVLKDRVTSPAGTTIAGLKELEAQAVRHAFAQAVVIAAERAKELGQLG